MTTLKSAAIFLLVSCGWIIADTNRALAEQPDAVDIGSRREPFVDHHLIGTLEGTRLEMHHPCEAGVALRFDKPWEGRYCGYTTIIKDGETYRMYYRGHPEMRADGSSTVTVQPSGRLGNQGRHGGAEVMGV